MRRWIHLLVGLAMLFCSMAALQQVSKRAEFARQLREGVEQNDQDHGSLFYTESAAADRAVQRLRAQLRAD